MPILTKGARRIYIKPKKERPEVEEPEGEGGN